MAKTDSPIFMIKGLRSPVKRCLGSVHLAGKQKSPFFLRIGLFSLEERGIKRQEAKII
jgi:hypothetical protein